MGGKRGRTENAGAARDPERLLLNSTIGVFHEDSLDVSKYLKNSSQFVGQCPKD
jgi:hypothetical protein